ncbi:xin actin-binding repeat-containing protein 1 [Pelobates fuscus]|uniref:xin actin-binding repeat-containing protein 1 n=1 Tax=Pelobates fuscus TaxID=191477 RepID=UPI002FE4D2E1
MADNLGKLSSTDWDKGTHETDFLPPPPSDLIQPSVTVSANQDQSFIPVPPPKESFSKFYEQRQVNELKRLYRHMHPELRKNLEHTVTRDLSELLSTDEPNQQTSVTLDTILTGEVQSMRWIFENWNLDSIGDHQISKKLADEEVILGGNVKDTSLKFQGESCPDGTLAHELSETEQTKGDVKTALWLFETQPLDSLNKIYPVDTDVQEAVLKDPVERGDVKGTKLMFETHSLDEVGRCKSVEENSILQLKSEIEELKGDVKKTVKLFQTEPLCAFRDQTGNIHEIKSICREETQGHSVNTARWLFETQPLDTIDKDTSSVRIIRGISLEEIQKGGVNATKWMFETQPLDTIKEHIEEGVFQASLDSVKKGDVSNTCKDDSTEEVLAGDVKSTLWLFETQPMEALKGSIEVGQLKKVDLLNEEKGDVKQRKHVFETCSLDKISGMEEESMKDQKQQNAANEIIKGDVKSFKTLFETIPLDNITQTSSILVSDQEDIMAGNVKGNQALFETVPLYAIEDSLGNYHEVTSISREEMISGDVKNYKWMFETKQLDQFHDSPQKVDIIKGITKQEIMSGDVGTAKWLFETQPVDVIHKDKNATDEHSSVQTVVSEKGDVKKCRWLFETQPADKLYEKSEKTQEKETLPQGDVKSYTWMFETQSLDSFKDTEEQYIKVSTAFEDDNCKRVNVQTTRHLFETEPLDNISYKNEMKNIVRYSSRIEIKSGKVSRVKEIFESKPNENIKKSDVLNEENIQKGFVNKFTWLFENCPMDSMDNNKCGFQELQNIQGGDVVGKKFIFETCSLDKIQQESDETEIQKVQEVISKADVKSCTMLFETKPLYAIQDKGGEYHEVTSVKKEEILKGDVRGSKWLFETKPLDMINKDEEVFVIRAVTQEDIEKGCVKSARWRFETEPLDSITDYRSHTRRTVDDVQKGDVQSNKQLFESQTLNQKNYVRLVSVSDVQKGNVRTSTWLFENQPIDSLKGESDEHHGIVKVQREDNQKGDVKRCTWLFETKPIDSLKDTETPTSSDAPVEAIPKDNVKSTTWLFESTPLDEFDFKPTVTEDEKERNVKDTLDSLFFTKIIQHKGIIIECFDWMNVKMAKFQLRTQEGTEILKEEILGGNLQRIFLQLLHRTDIEPQGLLVEENFRGEMQITELNLLNQDESGDTEEKHDDDDVAKALQALQNEDTSVKTGIIMEESEKGSVKIIVYSVSSLCKHTSKREDIIKGDVKSTIGNLLACSQEQRSKASVLREEKEKGKVELYKSCIEKGDLGYLKSLQEESEIEALTLSQNEPQHQELNNVQNEAKKIPENISKGSCTLETDCVYVSAKPVFPAIQPRVVEKKGVTFDAKLIDSHKEVKNICKVDKNDIGLRKASQTNTIMMERTTTKHTAEKESHVALEKECLLGQTASGAQQKDTASHVDLQTALLDLRQATEEAKSIQKQVKCKIQNNTEETVKSNDKEITNTVSSAQSKRQYQAITKHSTTARTTLKETKKACASLQTSTASTKKVSASEKEEQVQELFESGQEIKMVSSTESTLKDDVDSPKQAKGYLNPFIESDFNKEAEQGKREEDIVRGDVKAAIRALQNATSEQREVEKEEVVRGNLSSALQSLEKSNVNVSKGDFKAAMIYRNAGQSYSACKRKTDTQEQIRNQDPLNSPVESFPPPPAAVIGQELSQASKSPNVEATKDSNSQITDYVPKTPDTITKKASGKTLEDNKIVSNTTQTLSRHREKPVPPPKPKHLQASSNCVPFQRPKANKSPSTSCSRLSPATKEVDQHCTAIRDQANPARSHQGLDDGISQTCTLPTNEILNAEEEIPSHKVNEVKDNFCLTQINHCQTEHQQNVTMTKTEMTNTATSINLHASAQTMDHAILKEHALSVNKEVEDDGEMLKKHKIQEDARRKQRVTVTEPKDGHAHHGVVMRVKHKKETEEEKRKRLSVHKDEIMNRNVKAAMDIYENLRKQEELQKILYKVKEMEEETSNVDVRSMRGLFENVQCWIKNSEDGTKKQPEEKVCQKDEGLEQAKEDTESVSSVELAFEDLEKASSEIKHLKEQTLARLLDIEETIRKALYTVSNLKSESDIAGLSSLFRESLGTNTAQTNNIRKISIVSSKAKSEKKPLATQQTAMVSLEAQDGIEPKKTELDVVNVPSRAISPTSPSFITIESAARKPTQNNGSFSSTSPVLKNGQLPKDSMLNQSVDGNGSPEVQQYSGSFNKSESSDKFNQLSSSCGNGRCSQGSYNKVSVEGLEQNTYTNTCSPSGPVNSLRQKSVLELKTGPEGPKLIGKTIVTEKYEEFDQFGNKIIRSKTSTTVTEQSDTQSSSTYEVVSSPPRYEVTASPRLRRHIMSPMENSSPKSSETGVVFVTFGNSKPVKK